MHERAGPRPWPRPEDIHTIVFDFDGVFTDNGVYVGMDGEESVRCDRADGLALDMLRGAQGQGRLAAEMFILSREQNRVVLARARKLRLDCRQGVGTKLEFMQAHFAQSRAADPEPYRGLVVLGNDLNDLGLMLRAGFSVAPSDAHPRVRAAAHAVLPERGGHGFVRAFVERLLAIDQLTPGEIDELVRHR